MIELLGQYSRDIWELTYSGRVARLGQVLAEEPALARVSGTDAGTPLHWLPTDAESALATAELLLRYGADPAVRDGKGRTAAEIAGARGLDEVVQLLQEAERSSSS
ncbi:MAG: ankyrin repeat domain-containing protein [Gemmatimonadota bacterium]